MATNWLQRIKDLLGIPAGASVSADVAAVKVDTAAVLVDTADMQPKLGAPAGASMSADILTKPTLLQIEASATLAKEASIAALDGVVDAGFVAGAKSAEITALDGVVDAGFVAGAKEASLATLALEATLTAIKGGGWGTETLVAIKAAIDAIAGVNSYQEQIPDTDFNLAAVSLAMATDPPGAPAANSVVDIDQIGGSTFVLRSLWVNVTSFGTGTLLKFKLWALVNAVVTKVDEVDVTALGIQNLADIFGLQEVHADGIWVTVQCDVGATGACSGTYRFAKAS